MMRAANLLFGLLLAGVGGVNGANPCFARCKTGGGIVNLYGCGLTDDDLPGLATCLDDAGRGSIEYLYLSSNKLTTLPAGLFDGLDSAKLMLLNSNKLSALPAGLFDGLERLQYLYLMDNELTTLPEGLFDDLASVGDLFLQDNSGLQCVPANVATNVKTDDISFEECGCTPAKAVTCGKGVTCVPGKSGYTCGTAAGNPETDFHL